MATTDHRRHASVMDAEDVPSLAEIREAYARIAPYAHRTPVVRSRTLDRALGAEVFLKCENLQRVGAFKFRGACNAVFSMTEDEALRGVATHSSGNHAQALALAAQLRGVPATIVMPENAPAVKRRAVLGYGAAVRNCAAAVEAREAALEGILAETGAIPIHPYDDRRVIAGQGTSALELLEEVPDLDLVLVPVGGGGLLAGTALAAKGVRPTLRVIGCEPELVDDAARSFRDRTHYPATGRPTIADGLRTSMGRRNYAVLLTSVDAVVTVTEESIARATFFLLERTKLVVEPSGAVPVAALRDAPPGSPLSREALRGLRVGVLLSGGNIDLEAFFQNPVVAAVLSER